MVPGDGLTRRHSLNWVHCWSGSQWTLYRSTCWLWSNLFSKTIEKSSTSIQNSLQSVQLKTLDIGQQTFAIVDPWINEAYDVCRRCFNWERFDTDLNPAQSEEAVTEIWLTCWLRRHLWVEVDTRLFKRLTVAPANVDTCNVSPIQSVLRLAAMIH